MTKRYKNIPEGFLKNLEAFNNKVIQSNKTTENLSKLRDKNVLAIVTGQQVGILINPALALYKALTAIKLAEDLEKTTNSPVVPIFWLQTEDHDHEEVRNVYLLDKNANRINFSLAPEQTKRPIGLLKLGSEIDTVIESTLATISQLQFVKEAEEMIRASYSNGQDYGLCFAKLLARLVQSSGIIFIDPIACEVSKFSKSAYNKAIEQFDRIATKLREVHNSDSQVNLRDNATLFFFYQDSKRQRLIKIDENQFNDENKKAYSKADLARELENNPEKFSASALLRPLIQDSLLPTFAYIGGRAEINYLKQSAVLYPIFDEQSPKFIQRPSVIVIEEKFKKWLEELDISIKDLSSEKLVASKLLKNQTNPDLIFSTANSEINTTFDKIQAVIVKTDQTLLNSCNKAREKSLEGIKLLADKYTKAVISKEQIWNDRINKINSLSFPGSIPQERSISAIYLYAKFGPELIKRILEAIDTKDISKEIELAL